MKTLSPLFATLLTAALFSQTAWAAGAVGRKFSSTSENETPVVQEQSPAMATPPTAAVAPTNTTAESTSTPRTPKSNVKKKIKKPIAAEIKAPIAEDSKSVPSVTPQETQASAPVEAVQTTSSTSSMESTSYKLQAGDLLRINVWKEEELDREVLVMPDGTITFPLIGTFSVNSLTTADVQRTITQKLIPFIPAASVTVVATETRGNAVSVIGQVTKPGEVIMTRSMTVMQALSQAGGLTPYADDDDIVILRKKDGKEDSIEFDYSDIARGRNLETNITLVPGDVIVVPTQSLF